MGQAPDSTRIMGYGVRRLEDGQIARRLVRTKEMLESEPDWLIEVVETAEHDALAQLSIDPGEQRRLRRPPGTFPAFDPLLLELT
jgi:hypothetical protein